ncbi:peptidase S8 [Paenibacillus sambharensis]|uniref:Peptidase S8 n=1 Tax=Paenibacillus sambharensis TaxID=1803190 RepID=A0A2W1L7I5_9BACL|nr:S8 family peptidase [Paenibacillus sambharensis]PZD94943.1 peptidase S8 [Paenibacillus sambharensis]
MRLEETTDRVLTEIDPKLQRIIERNTREKTNLTTAVDGEEHFIPVIAKVTDIDEWNTIPGVKHKADMGLAPDKSGRIVTARVDMNELENVRKSSAVLSLKLAQPVSTTLNKTTEEINARTDLLPPSIAKDHAGHGVVVGIVDIGCDAVHNNFRNSDDSTRLLTLWNQHATGETYTGPFGYGRVFSKEEINQAIQAENPYEALMIPDELIHYIHDEPWHGTHVMDIAAGNGKGTGTPGVAPKADLVFVELAANDIPWDGARAVGHFFGDSAQVLEAVRYIFDTAGERPCVVNLSLGTNGGPHDGTSLVEQGFDAILNEKPNRAIVIAAANSYGDGIHASGKIVEGNTFDLRWEIKPNDYTSNELEIWYNGGDEFVLEVIDPTGLSIGTVQLGSNATAKNQTGQVVMFVAHRKHDPNNQDNLIGVFLERGVSPGTWTLRLHGKKVIDGDFHAWVERDDPSRRQPNNQSKFASPNNNSHTLGSIACGHKSIVVGSYNAYDPKKTISAFSSAGPTRDGRQKPEISAPGHTVIAAKSGSKDGTTTMSGTSMASPAITGVVALILAEANAQGIKLSIDQTREIVDKAARKNPPNASAWDERYGFGRIDAKAAIEAIKSLVPV